MFIVMILVLCRVVPLSQLFNKKGCCIINEGSFQVVQEYERAVIFRLGRLLSGGAKGPGMYILFRAFHT